MADIAYKRDIDRLVAKELGWDESKVKENSEHLFRRIKEVMGDINVDIIHLSHIGDMYIKTQMIKVKVNTNAKFQEKRNKKWDDILERYEKLLVNVPYKTYKKHNGRSRILNYYYNKKKNFSELQKFQNGED